MPRDQRLYITLPLDIHRHPKLRDKSPAVKWCFVEMNIEARIADNDGVFSIEDAEFLWPRELLDELVRTHPSRPVVLRTEDSYVIREYPKHQQTRASREDLHRKRAEAGRKGGLSKSQASASQVVSKEKQPEAESESESESEDFYSPSKSQSSSNRARVSTDAIPISAMTKRLAGQRGITSLRSVVDAIQRHCDVVVTADQAFQVSVWILDKAKTAPAAPQRYVTASIAKSPAEVQKHIYEAVA